MNLDYPNNRLMSAHDCIPFEYSNIAVGEPPVTIFENPYEGINISLWQDGTALHPFIQVGDYILIDGDKIEFVAGATVLPYQVHCFPVGPVLNASLNMANDIYQCLLILLPEYAISVSQNLSPQSYDVIAARNNCGKKQRVISGGFRADDSPSGMELKAQSFVVGAFENRTAVIAYEILHNQIIQFRGDCIGFNSGVLYVKPNGCDCLNATLGTADLDISAVLRAKMFAKFPMITDQYQPNIITIKKDMTRFFRVRGSVTANNAYANSHQNTKTILSDVRQAYNGILQPNFVQNAGASGFDIFTDYKFPSGATIHLPLNLNANGLKTCANQLRFAQWWVWARSDENYLQVQIVPIVAGVPTFIRINYLIRAFDGIEANSPVVFELNTGLQQLSAILAANGITDISTIDSISFNLLLLDSNLDVIYNSFTPIYYNFEKGCCCENQTQFIFKSSLGSWETIVLDDSASGKYEITAAELDSCMCCTTPEPAQAWQNSTKTETRNLTQIYRATLHNANYYNGDVVSFYDGHDYIKEFLASRHVYLVKPQQLIYGAITPASDWLFYRAAISNELPDISDEIPTVISYRLYKNSSLSK